MRAWLREDRVYHTVMNGALWIVVIAALSTTKWPQFTWLLGTVTAVLVAIVTVVYWIAVVTNDDDRPNSTACFVGSGLSKTEETQKRQDIEPERPPAQQREEILEAYLNRVRRNLEVLRERNLEELHIKTSEILRNWQNISKARESSTLWATNFDAVLLRNWLMHASHHGPDEAWMKSHRRAFTDRTLTSVVTEEEETSGKVVVTVGSIKIEIQEDDPDKTTTVKIISPKVVVTNLKDKEEDNQPEHISQQRPATTTIH